LLFETAFKPKMLTFVLPTEKLRLQFHSFFKYLGNQDELEKTRATKHFCDAGLSF